MTALTRQTLRGIWCATLLPIADDDAIDWPRLADDLDDLVAARPHGVYAHGSSGEFQTLTEAEYDSVNAMLAERCGAAGVAFQIGASHPSGQLSLERVRRAREFGPGAIQVVLPDWLPLTVAEAVDAVAVFAAAADPVPLVVYNPPHAKTVLTPEAFGRIAEQVPAVIDVKVAGGDAAWHARVREHAPGLAVFVAGHRLVEQLPLGAVGSYSNVACLSPRGAIEWYERALADPGAAMELHTRVQRFFDREIGPLQRAGFANPALDKFLAAVGGWSHAGLRVRWPHRTVPDDAVEPARRTAAAVVPELLAD